MTTDNPNEPQDLDQLSIKDLKRLAGEHNLPNRSRLAKQELVDHLRLLLQRKATEEGIAAPLAPAPASEPEVLGAEPVELTPEDVAPLAEPEVLQPADVLPADGESAESADDEDDDGEDDEGANGDEPGQSGEGEPRRRRRRRRRRRGRGRGGQNGDGQNGPDEANTVAGADDAAPAVNPEASLPAPAEAAAPAAEDAPVAPRDERRDDGRRNGGGRRDEPRREGQRDERERRDGRRDERQGSRPEAAPQPAAQPRREESPRRDDSRQPRPALTGPQRRLPAVLERLQRFTAGVLELCDPDTPGWAQARLGELLAESGVAPIPCQGLPHPQFHEVVGHLAGAPLPAGHIAAVEAPGFALRGDRGDLFPLRKAKVLVAGDSRSAAPVTSSAPLAAATPDREPEVLELSPETLGDTTGAAAPTQPAAPTEDRYDVREQRRDDLREPRRDDRRDRREGRDGRDRRDGRREDVRPRDEAPQDAGVPSESAPHAAPIPGAAIDSAAPGTETAAETAPPANTDVAAPRSDERRSRRDDERRERRDDERRERRHEEPRPERQPRQADNAPSLPLAPQEADELAARPKAEDFRPLGLNEQILADLAAIGFLQPTGIQAEAIPVACAGHDLIGQALTGTGKTAAYVLPLLDRLYRLEGQGPVALVLCPTRELARQVHSEFVRMAGASGARAALVYGGVSLDDQFNALARHPHVVIGTPGRVIDHLRRRTLETARIAAIVLDEADQMLDIGFMPDIEYIMRHTPPSRQTMLFSATMPEPIKALAANHMREPRHIHVQPQNVTATKVDQAYIAVDQERKTRVLAHVLKTQDIESMVVFCNTKHQTDRVTRVLRDHNLEAGAIHGDLPQSKRERTLKDFRDGTLKCLIATNVAARGLDIPQVSHVLNYDVPGTPEEYVHRIGRTGRMGREGVARTFITPEDGQFLLEIEKHIGFELGEELVEGITASTAVAAPQRTIADTPTQGPRILKPLAGGIRLGRRRR